MRPVVRGFFALRPEKRRGVAGYTSVAFDYRGPLRVLWGRENDRFSVVWLDD
jgi:hypothetical protein